jgi:hypothetical protein
MLRGPAISGWDISHLHRRGIPLAHPLASDRWGRGYSAKKANKSPAETKRALPNPVPLVPSRNPSQSTMGRGARRRRHGDGARPWWRRREAVAQREAAAAPPPSPSSPTAGSEVTVGGGSGDQKRREAGSGDRAATATAATERRWWRQRQRPCRRRTGGHGDRRHLRDVDLHDIRRSASLTATTSSHPRLLHVSSRERQRASGCDGFRGFGLHRHLEDAVQQRCSCVRSSSAASSRQPVTFLSRSNHASHRSNPSFFPSLP